jgi:hypothetical protein
MRVHCQPSDEFALAPVRLAAPPALAPRSSAAPGQLTKLDREPPRRKIAPALTANPQALQQVVNRTANAMLKAVVFPMVQQFNAVQNQMFDQFQQAIVLMFQRFSGLQKEQMELVRTELNRVQELTLEIEAVLTQMNRSGAGKPGRSVSRPELGAESLPATGTSSRSAPEGAAPQPLSGEIRNHNPEEVHAWLCQRMTELQQDRRSRLQKIIDFLCGS